MFYIVPYGENLDRNRHAEFNTLTAARQHAERSHQINGRHYRIIEIRGVWNTELLANEVWERLKA
jgi:hypothetical protein